MLLTLRLVLQFQELNRDENVQDVVVQLPLPEVVDSRAVLQAIDSEEHADCLISQFNCQNLTGEADDPIHCRGRAMGPCTPRGIMELFNRNGTPLFDERVPCRGFLPNARLASVAKVHAKTRFGTGGPGPRLCGWVTPASFSRPTSACGQAACEERLIPAPVDGLPTESDSLAQGRIGLCRPFERGCKSPTVDIG